MFDGFMIDAWIAGLVAAVLAGVVGFFVVLRGSAFVAHALPNGSFAGAAGAALVGIDTLIGLVAFALLGALGMAALGRRGRHDVVTALVLVLMLALGALFLDLGSGLALQVDALLFGEVLGVSASELVPTIAIAAGCLLAIALLYRPLLLSSVLPEVGEARGVRAGRIELGFLLVVALATATTVPVVGTLLVFSLMIGAPAAARAICDRPGRALALSVAISVTAVAVAIAGSYETDYPIGFFVGMVSAGAYLFGRLWAHARRRRPDPPSSVVVTPATLESQGR
jgi:zinc/manganese transport system permease protein